MIKDYVSVTDHIKSFSIEKKILGKYFQDNLNKNTTIILVWHEKIDDLFLKKYPSIRAVIRYGVGFDNIDLEGCKKRNILVANTPDYGIDEVSDSSVAMILGLTRKINSFQELAKQDNEYWLGKEFDLNIKRLNKLSLGIIGLGRIGSSLARKFSVFSRNIGFYDPYLPDGYEKIFGIERFDSLSNLLRSSDIVSINTPLTKETENMVDNQFLNLMKKGSYLINLSRGKIVKDQQIILEKLISNDIEGYATDVWQNEPPLEDDKLFLSWQNNDLRLSGRLIITPHTAYFSDEALIESRTKACKTCLDVINNKRVKNRII